MNADGSSAHTPPAIGWSKHRVEALTDGIFAVAMTLLVIDLKLPDQALIHAQAELIDALKHLLPRAISWLISFFVLATFWVGHHRVFHYVRSVDQGLLWRNIVLLALVSLMPFSSSIIGEYGGAFVSQVFYNANMMALGLVALWKARYVRLHPELCHTAMPEGAYHAARLRSGGLIAIGAVALIVARWINPAFATFAYLLMLPIGRYSRRTEVRPTRLQQP